MANESNNTPPPGQQEANLIRLQMKIEEEKRQAAKERAFKAIEDAKWDRIKKERARKKRLRETKGKG
jgi:hypothetical protein